jgi:hypothetical protein
MGKFIMNIGIGTKIYLLLSTLEAKHNLLWADGLHRQVLMAVLDAQRSGLRLTNQHIVDLNLTSRSSTYRKIADLKQLGFLSDIWDDTICYLTLGPAAIILLSDADNTMKAFSEKTD